MTAIAITFWPSHRHSTGKQYAWTWEYLIERLSAPRVEAVKGDAGCFAVATFRDNHRLKANVERVYAVGLDLDHLDAVSVFSHREPGEIIEAHDLARLRQRFATSAAFVHTTWSSTLEALRCRVFLLLSRPVTGEEYTRVYRAVAAKAEAAGLVVDRQASDPSRLWYLPAVRAVGCSMVHWTCDGAPVDVEAALAAVPPAPPPPPPSLPSGPVGDVEARAAAYVDKCDPAISGSGGHRITFALAVKLVKGFALDEATAYRLMARWNLTCSPPWSEFELRRKVRQAAEHGQMQEGALRDAQRRR